MSFAHLLASRRNGTLSVGVTNDLLRRIGEHASATGSTFTRKYGVSTLVWFEVHDRIGEAIARGKQIKGWNRAWKIRRIEASNPNWLDVSGDVPYS